jgi:hypothetical protein
VWECLQHLVRLHEKDGISHDDTAVLLKKINAQAEAVKGSRLLPLRHQRQQAEGCEGGHGLQRPDRRLDRADEGRRRPSTTRAAIVRSGWIFKGERDVAKSTRQYVFEGMELLPAALIPFVEKRLETSLKGHWQVQVLEKLPFRVCAQQQRRGRLGPAALFNAMMALLEASVQARCSAIRALAMSTSCSTSATSSRTTRPSPTTMPSARSIPCVG